MRNTIFLLLMFASGWSVAIETNSTSPTAVIYDTSVPVQCQEVESVLAYSGGMSSAINDLVPVGATLLKLKLYPLGDEKFSKISSGVIVPPQHGKLTITNEKYQIYTYEADKDTTGIPYQGPDTVVFWVQIEGKHYKVVQNLAVVPTAEGEPSACTTMRFSHE
jgi:hypothetical protein